MPNLNFFVKITVAPDGGLSFRAEALAGRSVTLRAEMDTLVVLSNTPHPLDPARSYAPKPIELSLLAVEPAQQSDLCRTRCEQNERGFLLTEDYHS